MVLKVKKEQGGRFSAQSFDVQGKLEWESTEPMTVDQLLDHLMGTLHYPQVDIYEQLSIVDPDRFGSATYKQAEMVEKVLGKNKKGELEINPLLKKQLENFAASQKNKK